MLLVPQQEQMLNQPVVQILATQVSVASCSEYLAAHTKRWAKGVGGSL